MGELILVISRFITLILITLGFVILNLFFMFIGVQPEPPKREEPIVRGGDEPDAVRLPVNDLRGNTLISSFQEHLSEHFRDEIELDAEEIQSRFLLSLEGLANEITHNVGAGKAWSEVEMEKVGEDSFLTGHLHWDIDKYSPKVYAICMALLLDGFVYIAERNAYMITSKVAK